jgi:hypothetical protein
MRDPIAIGCMNEKEKMDELNKKDVRKSPFRAGVKKMRECREEVQSSKLKVQGLKFKEMNE